jgi:hypothetical protein
MKGAEQRWTCHRYTLFIYVLFILGVSYTFFGSHFHQPVAQHALNSRTRPSPGLNAEGKNESKPQRTEWDALLEKLGLAGILLDPMQSLLLDKARLGAHLETQSYSRYVAL